MNTRLVAWVGTIVLTATMGAAQRSSIPAAGGARIESLAGVDTYRFYCAGCHGDAGHGEGPVAATLATPVPDLTMLMTRNGGTFPRDRVRAAVLNTDRPIAAHGTGDMPNWGAIFTIIEGAGPVAAARLDGVVAYVESLQAVPATVAVGRELYMAHCASCHGRNGGGDGPVAGQLRRPVPDLTAFTIRNGGVFPSARLEQIIDGRGAAAHGTREMPIWGQVFRREPGVEAAPDVAARIRAIGVFLASIQRRRG